MRRLITAIAAGALVASAPVTVAGKDRPPELSQVELSRVQTRTYSTSDRAAIAAAVAALQAQGYLDIAADRDAGTVSGHTDAKSKLMFNIFWGLGKKKLTQTAQFLIEEMRPGEVTLTLNLFVNESKTRSIIFGSKNTDAMLIRYADPYQALLAVVDAEVVRRGGSRTGESPSQPAAPQPAKSEERPAELKIGGE